jgi:uncharacterized membrane protein SirB2
MDDERLNYFMVLKLVHIACAMLSISGFALRGWWMLTGNALLQTRLARVLPHLVDTLLLGSAIWMVVLWQVNPFQLDWLSAKIIALLVYIGLGMVALRFGKTRRIRVGAYVLALATATYIVSVAYSKSVAGLLAVVSVQVAAG